MMVTQLTSSSDCVPNISRVPTSNTPNSSPTSMGLLLQMLNTISLHDTASSLSSSHTKYINGFVLLENLVDSYFFFEQLSCEFHLLFNGSTIDLNFKNMVLLLSEVQFIHVGMDNSSDDCAILDDSLELEFLIFSIFS